MKKSKAGGRREGAGRPKKEPTKVVAIRVPVKYAEQMKAAMVKEYYRLLPS